MSRAHAVAPMVGAEAPFRGPVQGVRPTATRGVGRAVRQATTVYFERAMLLWPRLDRAKIRRVSQDPARIAEIVERRTSQPYDVILAMLTKQSATLSTPIDDASDFDSGRIDSNRISLRIVRSEEGNAIEVEDLLPSWPTR